MIFTPFSGPVLWIGKEKYRCFGRVPWPGCLNGLLAPTSAGRLGDEKALEILTARVAKVAQFNPCDEPLAFSSSL
jgi:hypothetical protein